MFVSYDLNKINIHKIISNTSGFLEFDYFFFNQHLINKNCAIEIEEGKKIGKIETFFKFNEVIFFKVKIYSISEDKLGIFNILNLTNCSPNLSKFIFFKDVKVIFYMLKQNDLIFLVNKIFVI
jgi:hypothetical protein